MNLCIYFMKRKQLGFLIKMGLVRRLKNVLGFFLIYSFCSNLVYFWEMLVVYKEVLIKQYVVRINTFRILLMFVEILRNCLQKRKFKLSIKDDFKIKEIVYFFIKKRKYFFILK